MIKTNYPMFQTEPFGFWNWGFIFGVCFGFRYSDFGFVTVVSLRLRRTGLARESTGL